MNCYKFTCQKYIILLLERRGITIAASKEQKQNKSFAEKLLRIKGVDYDEWLDQRHQEIINENQALILEALDSKLNNKPEILASSTNNSN